MTNTQLTNKELLRLKHAAAAMGFPWQAIAERPRTARNFIRRVEAELAGDTSPAVAKPVQKTRRFGALIPRLSIALA